jgi:hypothetical protein
MGYNKVIYCFYRKNACNGGKDGASMPLMKKAVKTGVLCLVLTEGTLARVVI